MSTTADANDDATDANGGASDNSLSGGDMGNVARMDAPAKVVRVMSGTNGVRASVVYRAGQKPVTMSIVGLPANRALAIFTAVERLLNGAYVFDGDDLAIIRDGMRIARSEISGMAPEHEDATLALGALESAMAHLEVVS